MARKNVSVEGVDAWWKLVAVQSERQRGSFFSLWISEFDVPPPQIDRKLDKLRNECVHKGTIPTADKAEEHGQAVLRAELTGVVTLRNLVDSEDEYDDFVAYVIRRPGDQPLATWEASNVISRLWRVNESYPHDNDPEDPYDAEAAKKNPTDPRHLSIDRALRIFRSLRGLGLRP